MLNNAAILYQWDEKHRKEREKAKSLFRKARTYLRVVENDKGEAVEHWREIEHTGYMRIRELETTQTQVLMRILQKDGDKTICWDCNVKDEVIEAAQNFKDYTSKGWIAYAVDPQSGKKGHRLQEFNAEKEEITFVEGPVMKLREFAKKFRKVEVAAKTYPG